MLKKILKEIQKLEKEKETKSVSKKKLELEINELSNKLKQLYSIKNEFEKIENNANDYFNSKQNE
ncbi:hypothetical protein [Faecalibacillus intestinalis]|uniref:hypothetical protein n=1 Tax=Faecalibacillus intestinalis TaxID=1982626 RepID=UPI0022DED30A|nr:hypothetical protein [Faecalibacillus intestinalis]